MRKDFIKLSDIPKGLLPFINNKSESNASAWYKGKEVTSIYAMGETKYHINTVEGQHRADDAEIEIMY